MSNGRLEATSPLERYAPQFLLAFALVLRLREAVRTPLWFDELYTLDVADRPWREMLGLMSADVHPPLHFVLVWIWRVFGPSDLALRSLSILAAMGALALSYLLAKELFSRRAALLVLAFLAAHPWHVYVSQEARSYPLLWLALCGSALGAWRWSERGRGADAALFVLASAAALWTHYLAGVVLGVQALWGVARFAREPRRLGAWVLLHVGIAALFAPIAPLLWTQFHRVEVDFWLKPPTLADLFDFVRRCAFANNRLVWPLLLLTLWPLADSRARRATTFALAIGPAPVMVCWWLGTHGIHIFAVKYMMFALPAVFTLLVAGVLRLPGRVLRYAVTGAMLVFALRACLLQPGNSEARSNRIALARLAPRVRAGDVIFHEDTHTFMFARRYLPQARSRLLPMGQRVPYFDGAAILPDSSVASASELRETNARGQRWFAMVWGRGGLKPAAAVALFDSFAVAAPETCGLERIWTGPAARGATR